jgi:predicted esterase
MNIGAVVSSVIHRFERGTDPARPVMLVLHGTGGDEHDLIPLARTIDPAAPILSPRGRVIENGMPRFFRRLAEGVFDEADLRVRTAELAEFIGAAAQHYGFDPARVVAVGYSNGANIAASLLLAGTNALAGAVLLRPMVPFEPAVLPDLRGRSILVSASRRDPIVPPVLTERLADLLTSAGADVTTAWWPSGHGLSQQEIEAAREWLRKPRSPG